MHEANRTTEQLFLNSILTFENHALVATDETGLVTLWNPGAERLWGYTKAEMLGRSVANLVADSNGPEITRTLLGLLSLGEKIPMREIDTRHKDGRRIAVLLNLGPLFNEKGDFCGSSNIAYSFEEQRILRNAMKQREHDYRTIFEYHPTPFWLFDGHTGKFTQSNLAASQAFGYNKNEFEKIGLYDLLTKNRSDAHIHIDLSKNYLGTHQVQRKDGSKFWAEISAHPLNVSQSNTYLLLARDTTDEILANEEATKWESRFRNALDNMTECVQIISHNWTCLYVNKAMAQMAGLDKTKMIGRPLRKIFPDIENTSALTLFENCLKTGTPERTEIEYEFADGDRRWLEVNILPIPEGLYVTYTDQTEKKTLNNAISEKETAFHNTLENMLEGIEIIDRQWRYTYVNRAAESYNRYPREKLIGHTVMEIFPNIEDTPIFAAMKKSMEQREHLHTEINFIFPDGSAGWFELSIQPVPQGILVLSFDIGKRKEAEENSRVAIHKLSNYEYALEHSAIIAITDHFGNITYANDNFCTISGYTNIELIGKNHRIINSGLHSKKFFKDLWNTILSGKVWRGELRNKRKDGTYYWVDTTIVPLKDDRNIISDFLSIRYDITDRVKFKEDLQRLNIELQELASHTESVREQERTSIARDIHDDLGQQLTGLKMGMNWLIKRSENDCAEIHSKAKDMYEMVNNSIESMRHLIHSLRPVILDELGLFPALEWLARDFEKNTGTRCVFNNLLEKERVPQKLNTTLYRIFQEALTNITRHAQASRVTAELFEDEDNIVFEIVDNGIGIQKSDPGKNPTFGLLGMRERAKSQGGTLLINALPEGGTQITLKIPVGGPGNTQD